MAIGRFEDETDDGDKGKQDEGWEDQTGNGRRICNGKAHDPKTDF